MDPRRNNRSACGSALAPPRRRARSLALALLLAGAAGRAQGAGLSVASTLRASPAQAAQELDRRRGAVMACVRRAEARDPERLAGLRRVLITLRLNRSGRAVNVSLDPPLLTPGLSECLADALLPWDQGGRPGLRAWVRLRLDR